MTPRKPRSGLLRAGAAGLALCAGLGSLTACTSDDTASATSGPVPAYRLVAFDSCADALAQIRSTAKEAVGPYGFGSNYAIDDAGGLALPGVAPGPQKREDLSASAAGSSATNQSGTAPVYSGTNNQEASVDEPDLVKTDGHRILVVHNGVLRIIDAASQRATGSIDLTDGSRPDDIVRYGASELLISGDHALVLVNGGYRGMYVGPATPVPVGPPMGDDVGAVGGSGSGAGVSGDAPKAGNVDPAPPGNQAPDAVPTKPSGPTDAVPDIVGPRLILVDLVGGRVLSRLSVDGSVLDARQTGSVARVVVTSSPRITFPNPPSNATATQRVKVNRQILDQATLDRWLPRIAVTTGSATTHPEIGCDAISRPDVYSGSNMLTVLSLDVAADTLADPQPVSIMADGQTVYSNGSSLYVATDQRWRPAVNGAKPVDGTTVYQFDTSKPGRPTFVAGGGVPGFLVNQYAMSARNGYLRVATTSGNSNWESNSAVTSQSGVYVLRADGSNLTQVGKVEGLGKGEKIYAVRFLDATAYVVTFKQTDPLYTVDLSDPARSGGPGRH